MSSTVAVSGGSERANARMSVGVDNVDGFVPNNYFQKATGLLSGSLQVSPRLSTNAVLQYARNNGKNRPGTGYNNSILERSEEHTSELQSQSNLVCRLLLEKKKDKAIILTGPTA